MPSREHGCALLCVRQSQATDRERLGNVCLAHLCTAMVHPLCAEHRGRCMELTSVSPHRSLLKQEK